MSADPEAITVLHVEDDPAFAEMTGEFLRQEDDRLVIETAATTEEALDRLTDEIDCIVSDYDLPDGDGIGFLETVRETHPDLPFILFTGKGSEEVASEAIAAGVTGYLQKSTGPEQYELLANRIRNTVAQARAERDVKRQRQRFQVLFENFPEPTVAYAYENGEPHVTQVNEAFTDVFGYERAEVLGEPIDDVIVPPARRGEAQRLDERVKAGESIKEVVRRRTRDGLRDFRFRNIRLPDDARIDGYGIYADVTELKEHEQELERRNELFRKAQDIADVGAWEYDVRTDDLTWTAEVYEIHDVPVGTEITPETAIEFYHPDDRETVRAAFERALEEGEPYDIEVRLLTAADEQRWVHTRGDPTLDDGEPIRVRGTIQDVTERKERERELERSHELIEALSSTFPDYTFVYDDEGTYLDVITGWAGGPDLYRPEELIGQSVGDVLDGDTADRIHETIQRTLETGELQTVEYSVDTPGGTYWYEANLAPLPEGYEGRSAVVFSAREITDRKAYEVTLHGLHEASTRLLRAEDKPEVCERVIGIAGAVLDHPYVSVFLWDPDEGRLRAEARSDTTRQAFGEPPTFEPGEGLVGTVFETGERIVLDDAQRDPRILDDGAEDVRGCCLLPLAGYGVLVFASAEVGVFTERDVELAELLAAHTIVAFERIETEAALRDRERELERQNERLTEVKTRYESLFENNPVVVWEEDFSSAKAYVDELAERVGDLESYLRAHPEEVDRIFERIDIIDVNRTALEYYDAGSKAELIANLEQLATEEAVETNAALWARIAEGATRFRAETVAETLAGDRRNELLEMRVPEAYADDYSRVYITAIDVTERKERERELKRQNERLEEFASIVSHDLRNPLNVAMGRLALAREDCPSDHLDAVERAHDRMETLIEDVLALARHGRTVEATQPVDLAGLVEACRETVATGGATLCVDTEATVRADRSRLQQLLENLIRNAVEHGGADVTVTVGELEDGTGFYVADDGPGIDPDERDRVFEPGYSTTDGGTGFGLNIVREIVHAHGWEIRVTDSVEGGARFEITGVTFADER